MREEGLWWVGDVGVGEAVDGVVDLGGIDGGGEFDGCLGVGCGLPVVGGVRCFGCDDELRSGEAIEIRCEREGVVEE